MRMHPRHRLVPRSARTSAHRWSLVLLATVLVVGCDEASPTAEPSTPPVTTTPTWNDDIGPLLQQNCGSCHHAGGSGQFDLLSYDSASKFGETALAAMESGRMPPWPPSAGCRDYVGERRLPEGAIDRFRQWVRGGRPVGGGAPGAFQPPSLVGLRPDLQATMPEPYTPSEALTDDYRCFLLDLNFTEDTWVEGVDVTPGTPQVHHVLMYAIGASALATAEAADADEAGPGYTCFGGPVPSAGGSGMMGVGSGGPSGLPVQIGAWVPGMDARQLPPDSALRIPAGSRIVMQVHYNTIGGSVVPDVSSVLMQTRADAPPSLFRTVGVAQPELRIDAGDPASRHSITIRNWSSKTTEIAAAAHHMHTLGDSIRAFITRADGAGEECLLDIPSWDFQWQMQYQLAPGSHAFVAPGDRLTLECTYDNSPSNQPVVDGAKQQPREVTWGEGTFDEMCLMYVGILSPWTGGTTVSAPPCAGAKSCFDACPTSDATCLLNCEGAGVACLSCAAQGLVGCGAIACAQQLQQARECILPCAVSLNAFGGSIGTCMQGTCPAEWEQITACLDPFVVDSACASVLPGCGL